VGRQTLSKILRRTVCPEAPGVGCDLLPVPPSGQADVEFEFLGRRFLRAALLGEKRRGAGGSAARGLVMATAACSL
jgi:hypothetical protein